MLPTLPYWTLVHFLVPTAVGALYLWSALHFFLAGRTLTRDLAR